MHTIQHASFLGDACIGEDDVDAALLGVDFFEDGGLAVPGGCVAGFEGEAGGGEFGAQRGEGGFAGLGVDVEDGDVGVGLGGEVAGYAEADAGCAACFVLLGLCWCMWCCFSGSGDVDFFGVGVRVGWRTHQL